jgi:putative redox protein
MRNAIVHTRAGKFQQAIAIGPHQLLADEPADEGGDDAGPAPQDFLLAALGACTSMTVKLYADRKGWPLESVRVELSQAKDGATHVMQRKIHLTGNLDDEQRARLLEIAGKCPIHRTLTGEIRIESALV